MTTYELVDIDQRHQGNPEGFWVPPLEGRKRVPVGLFVKLIFELPDDQGVPLPPDLHGRECGSEMCSRKAQVGDRVTGERMWVKVLMREDINGRIRFRGALDNVPSILIGCIEKGDLVNFGPENIIDAEDPDKVIEE